ncbi:Uncharacterised protein [Prevotella intermedia]|nr:Uncharacterised protein [Prevotella intermedia]
MSETSMLAYPLFIFSISVIYTYFQRCQTYITMRFGSVFLILSLAFVDDLQSL